VAELVDPQLVSHGRDPLIERLTDTPNTYATSKSANDVVHGGPAATRMILRTGSSSTDARVAAGRPPPSRVRTSARRAYHLVPRAKPPCRLAEGAVAPDRSAARQGLTHGDSTQPAGG
jgi:hypothetical protein